MDRPVDIGSHPPPSPVRISGGLRGIAEAAMALAAGRRDGVLAVALDAPGNPRAALGPLILLDRDGIRAGALAGRAAVEALTTAAVRVLDQSRARQVWIDDGGVAGSAASHPPQWLLLPLPAAQAPLRDALCDACEGGAWLRLRLNLAADALGAGEARIGSIRHIFAADGHRGAEAAPTGPQFGLALAPPPRLLLLGSGPLVPPLGVLTRLLGWYLERVDAAFDPTVTDEVADRVHTVGPDALADLLAARHHDAAVVANHDFDLDLCQLRVLAAGGIGYIGLVGTPERREALLARLGDVVATRLEPRLYAPIGLRLGGDGPEAIALAIAAQLQHYFSYEAQGG